MQLNSMTSGERTVKPFRKMVPSLWTYDIQDKAKIFDSCGYEIAEVESEFVAHEIASVLNHYQELTECLEDVLSYLYFNEGITHERGSKALKRCQEIYDFEMPKEVEDDDCI